MRERERGEREREREREYNVKSCLGIEKKKNWESQDIGGPGLLG